MSAARFFVDTNVFVYSLDPAEPVKQKLSSRWIEALWLSQTGRISWQVLHELYVTAARKRDLNHLACRETVEALTLWHPVDVTFGLIERAWYWVDKAQLTYWDSLILASAERQECRWLLTEDFTNGRSYGMVTALNPFLHSPDDIDKISFSR